MKKDELGQLLSATRKLCEGVIPRYQTSEYWGTVPRALYRTLAEGGLSGLRVPEEYGGSALGPVEVARVFEEISRVDMGVAVFLSVHAMVCGLVTEFGTSSQKEEILPAAATGDLLLAFALTEPTAGSDARAIRSTARLQGDRYLLKGEKCYITSAGFADYYLTFARTGDHSQRAVASAFLIRKEEAGLIISPPDKKMGGELSPIASLAFKDLWLERSAFVGQEGEGFNIAFSGLAGGRVNIAACANGISQKALEVASTYLKQRTQFGKPLSEFQGLQFMLADMQIQLDAARCLTEKGAQTLLHGSVSEALLAAAVAKCFATDAAMKITTDAVQLLGGAGYLVDYGVERLMREAKMLQIVEGTNQIQRSIIAKDLLQ